MSSYTPHAKIRRSIALSAALLAVASGCSGASPAPAESTAMDMDADPPVATDDGSDADSPPGDASTSADAGAMASDAAVSAGHDAGTTTARDAGTGTGTGTVHVSCSELQLGVCQNATVSASKEASWRSQCTMQGGTADACPTTNVVGCCVGDTAHYCYYAPDYDVSMAQEGCSIMNGTWSPTM